MTDVVTIYLDELEDTPPVDLLLTTLVDRSLVRVYLESSTVSVAAAPIYKDAIAAGVAGLAKGGIYFDFQGRSFYFKGRRASFNFDLRSIYTLIRRLW
jgi:hypothetical protein